MKSSLNRAEAEALYEKAREYVESMPWGHQIRASVYVEGDPTDGAVQDFIELLNNGVPSAHFIGVEILPVQDEPQDQGAA